MLYYNLVHYIIPYITIIYSIILKADGLRSIGYNSIKIFSNMKMVYK